MPALRAAFRVRPSVPVTRDAGYQTPVSSSALEVFYTCFYNYNHAYRTRLKKLLYLELPRSSNGFLKALPASGSRWRFQKSKTAVTKPFRK